MVGTGAGEGLDPKRLFDGLEEQLDLPAVLVDGRDGGGRQLQVVGDPAAVSPPRSSFRSCR